MVAPCGSPIFLITKFSRSSAVLCVLMLSFLFGIFVRWKLILPLADAEGALEPASKGEWPQSHLVLCVVQALAVWQARPMGGPRGPERGPGEKQQVTWPGAHLWAPGQSSTCWLRAKGAHGCSERGYS